MNPRAIFAPLLSWISRHKLASALALLVIALRVALPFALVPILEAQVNDRLHAHARLGDIDLQLLRGAVVLEDVQLWWGDPPGGPTPAASAAPEKILDCAKVVGNVEWLQLPRRRLALSELAFEGLDVSVIRRASGELALASLVRGEATQIEDALVEDVAEESASDWTFALAHLALRRSHVTFDDRSVETPPLALEIRDLELDGGEWASSGDGQLRSLTAIVGIGEEGVLSLTGKAGIWKERIAADLRAEATGLRLESSQAYAGELGWVKVQGRLGFEGHYRLAEGEHSAQLSLTLEDGLIAVADDHVPALEVGALDLRSLTLDLLERTVRIDSVTLEGGSLEVHPGETRLLPVAARALADAQEQLGAAAAARDASPDPGDPDDPVQPWAWEVGELSASGLTLRVHEPDDHLEIETAGRASDLRSVGGEGARFALDFAQGEGRLHVEGSARVAPAGVSATLSWAALDLPRLLDALPATAHLVRSGTSHGELRVSAGLGERSAQGARDLFVEGSVSLPDFRLTAADEAELDLGWQALDVGIEAIRVPDLLPGADGSTSPGPPDIRLSSVTLASPRFALTRGPAGFVLPTGRENGSENGPETGAETGEAAQASAPNEAAPAEDAPGPGLALALRDLKIDDGRLQITDDSYEPAVRTVFSELSMRAAALAWPRGDARELTLTAKAQRTGSVSLSADVAARSGEVELELERVPLPPLDALTLETTGYSVAKGEASLRTNVDFDGSQYKSRNSFTLHDLALGNAESGGSLDELLDMPAPLALALLRDFKGDVSLGFPLEGDFEDSRVGFVSALQSVLRSALVGALSTPIKGLATLVPRRGSDSAGSLQSEPLSFAPGRAELTPESRERVARLADLIVPRPGLRVTLTGLATREDNRVLRERALLAQLRAGDRPEGVNLLEALRLRRTLEARERGEPAELSEKDLRLLASALEDPTASELALASARAQRVAEVLREEEDVEPHQISISDPPSSSNVSAADDPAALAGEVSHTEAPGVEIRLGALSES